MSRFGRREKPAEGVPQIAPIEWAEQAEKRPGEADLRPGEDAKLKERQRAKPEHAFHQRVNAYELLRLQEYAREDDTSIQRLVRGIIRDYIARREGTSK